MGLQAVCNLAAFGVNTAVTFGLGTRGLLGARTNKAVSAEFPTLCTPAPGGWAFAIWGPIFLLEGRRQHAVAVRGRKGGPGGARLGLVGLVRSVCTAGQLDSGLLV